MDAWATLERAPDPVQSRPPLGRPLALAAFSYALWHHLGGVPGGFGSAPGGTRVADWIDLLTPYAVLGPVVFTLWTAQASRRTWLVFVVASWVYCDGHGIHLSANSVGNSAGYLDPTRTAHWWDEYVGHYLWYSGVAVIVVVVASTLVGRTRPRHPGAWLLAVLVGVTWFTNSVAGNMTWGGLVFGVAVSVWGLSYRRDQAALLAASGLTSVLLLGGWLIIQPPITL